MTRYIESVFACNSEEAWREVKMTRYIEQELGSIAKFFLEVVKEEGITPYFHQIQEGFKVPAIYFPNPTVQSFPDTLDAYSLSYLWIISVFACNSEEAWRIAYKIQNATLKHRCKIPLLIQESGETDNGEIIRVKEPTLTPADDGICNISVSFDIDRDYAEVDSEKISKIMTEIEVKNNGRKR